MTLRLCLCITAAMLWLATPLEARADSVGQGSAHNRSLLITTLAISSLGAGMLLSASALETTLIVQSAHERPGSAYGTMQNLVGPLAGVGSLLAFPLGILAFEADLPNGVDAALTVLGMAGMIAGLLLWTSHAERIGETQLRRPVHQGGALLFSVGWPVLVWGGSRMYMTALAGAFHP
jgi:hypothetical protein